MGIDCIRYEIDCNHRGESSHLDRLSAGGGSSGVSDGVDGVDVASIHRRFGVSNGFVESITAC